MADPSQKDRPSSLNPAHLAILERYGGKRGAQTVALIAAAQLLWPVGKAIWERFERSEDFTITVSGVDDIYPDLHEWVLERIPKDERKAMIASTVTNHHGSKVPEKSDGAGPSEAARVHLRYDGSRSQSVTIDGHKVIVAVERENIPDRVNLSDNWRQYLEKITFTAATVAGRDAIVRMISGLVKANYDEEPPALYMPTRWGNEWHRRGDLPPRTLDSTILKDGQLERLMADIGNFLSQEADYSRLSQPWHRGYLFHGAPGTGKTSVARALANHFDLPTYFLPLGDIDKDMNLMQFVSAIRPRSVLLLEDIDVFHAATDREEDKDKSSVAALLNALDGLWTPHGLITVMTTNNREALDKALIRPGRIDVDEEFTALDAAQARRIAEFFDCPDFDWHKFDNRSPAELTEALKRERGKICAAS